MPRSVLRAFTPAALVAVLVAASASALWGQTPQELLARGQSLEQQGKAAEAIAAYTQAIAADAKFSEAYRRRALVYASLGNRREAITDFTRAIDADPKSARAYNGRGASKMALLDWGGARQDIDMALTLDPNYSNAHANRGRIKAFGFGDVAGGLADVTKSIEIDPKNRVSYWVRAELRFRLKDHAGAIADYTQAFELDPRDPAPLVLRANVRVDRGDVSGAERDFKAALAINPAFSEARDGLEQLAKGQKVALLEVPPAAAPARAPAAAPAPAPVSAAPPAPAAAPSRAPAATPERAPAAAPVEGRVMVSAIPPELEAAVTKYTMSTTTPPSDVPWREASGEPVRLPTRAPPSQMPPALDLNRLSIEQYNGAVSTAMEQMRLLQGPMSAEETQRFERKWAALYDAPTAELLDYFNALNPPLAEFISVRAQIELGAAEYRASVVAATIAAEQDDEEGARTALSLAATQMSAIEAQQARMAELMAAIQKIGNPPDPAKARRRARAMHEQAMKVMGSEPPYAELLGIWMGELIPMRASVEPRAMLVRFFEGVFQPSEHIAVQFKWPWDRPELVVHDPKTNETKYAVGFGYWTDELSLGVVMRDGALSAHNYGPPWIADMFGADKDSWVRELRASGDDLTGVLRCPAAKDGDCWRLNLRRVRDGGAPDPTGHDAATALRMQTEIDSLRRKLAELNQRQERDQKAQDALNAERRRVDGDLINRQFKYELPIRFARNKPALLELLLRWQPRSPAEINDPASEARKLWYAAVAQRQAESEQQQAARLAARQAQAAKIAAAKADTAAAEALSAKQREEEIAGAKLRILALEKDIEFFRRQLNTLKKEQLDYAELNLKAKQADVLQEQDYIAYLQTGEYRHTRSPLDEWNFERGVASANQDAIDAHVAKQGAAAAYKLLELADPAQREQMRQFVDRQLTPKVLGSNDVKAIKKVVEAVANQAMGYQQKVGAQADLDATDAEEYEYWTRQAVTALGVATGGVGAQAMAQAGYAGWALQAGSMGIGALYGAATGYVADGPVQAVENAAASTGLVAFGIIEGFKGYYEPVIDPATGKPTGEVRGLTGAAERAATSVAVGFVIGKGVQVLAGLATPVVKAGLTKLRGPSRPLPVVPTQAELKAVTESGERLVRQYGELRARLTAATGKGASKAELNVINAQLEAVANEVDANYAAKSMLQKLQKQGSAADKLLAKDFRVRQKMINKKVDAQFEKDLAAGKPVDQIYYEEWTPQGWVKRPLKFRDIRNATSGRKLNMDRDKALQEHPLYARDENGKLQPVLENWVLHPNGTPKMPKYRLVDGTGKRITMATANERLQATFERSYQTVTGQDAKSAFQTLTSSANTEAYRDLRWVANLRQAGAVKGLEATGAMSAKEVAEFKGFHSSDPTLAPLLKDREVARASAKEIRLRVLPLLEKMQGLSPKVRHDLTQHWQKLSNALTAYVENPVGAGQQLRGLTGKSLGETMADIGFAIETAGRLGKL